MRCLNSGLIRPLCPGLGPNCCPSVSQSFKSKSNSKLELKSSEQKISSNKIKIAVKVVDVFGNDTMKTLEIKI